MNVARLRRPIFGWPDLALIGFRRTMSAAKLRATFLHVKSVRGSRQ